MNELVYLKADDVFTDSMILAEATENQHTSIVRLIKSKRKRLERFGTLRFMDLKSKNSKGGRPVKCYLLNEPQATLLITFLNNSEKVDDFKTELVRQFFEMRKFIAERHTEVWLETRQTGKITRRELTDMIQQLIEYAKGQGSTHSQFLYKNYTELAQKLCKISSRDSATTIQLNNLSIFENIMLHLIKQGMEKGMNYKDIYKECKDRCIKAQQIAMIGG